MSRLSFDSESEPSPVDRAIAEYLQARDTGVSIDREEFLSRYPEIRTELADFIDNELNAQGWMHSPLPQSQLDQTVDFRGVHQVSISGPGNSGQAFIRDLGPYRLTAFLGEGGMGKVYEAVDSSGQHVAVKVLNQQWSKNTESMERFKQEGALAGTINHPRCVFVRAVDEVDGQPFIVMELMSGKTLKDLVAKSGPLSTSVAVSKILDVIDGLQEAHERGVIHRDIKPANCFLEPSGRVKLGDFGLARSVQQESELTQSGSFIGTPLFASPEQIRGEQLDYRTDIYSVCATLYYLLTGQAPFGQYSSTQVIARIVSDDPVPVRNFNPTLPKLLEQVVQRGLSRNRDRRFQDLTELKNALEPFVSGRQAIAQLARRLAAYGFDTCLLTIVLFALAGLLGDQLVDPGTHTLRTLLVYHGLAWGYFILSEGLWSATPGKMALQLRVVDSRTGEQASIGSIVWRTAIYLVIGTEASSVVLFLLDDLSSEWQIILQSVMAVVGIGILSITLRSKHGARLLHDVLSNTIVVASHGAANPVRLIPSAPVRELSATSSAGWPSQLGAYDVNGVIWQSDQQALLSGRDPRLNRQVWLFVDRNRQAELSHVEQFPSRPARLRYLVDGETESIPWAAYVAPSGAPLRYWVTPEQHLSWREARLILEQLIEEFRQSREDQNPLKLTSLDQLWLDAQGRISITDWSLCAPDTTKELQSISGTAARVSLVAMASADQLSARLHLRQSEQVFAMEAMRMSLTGKSRPLDSVPTAVEAPLPLHARKLLEQLLTTGTALPASFEDLQTQLRESAVRPSVVNPTIRLWMIGISMVTLLAFIGAMISISRVGNQAALMKLEDSWLEASAIQAIVENGEWFAQWQESLGGLETGEQTSLLEIQTVISNNKEACLTAIEQRWQQAGFIQRQILAGGILPRVVQQTGELSFQREPGEAFALRLVDGPPRFGNKPLTTEVLLKRWEAMRMGDLNSNLKKRWAVLVIAQSPFMGLVLWSVVSRGGLPFLFLGIYIIRQNGVRASRWIIFWRSLLVWLPMIVLNGMVVAIDLYAPELGWLATTLHLAMLSLLPVYAAIALRWPDCGPQDWLTGTRLVPA